ncbi:hypothetical protein CDAR_186021 [Caerostris darwini]|uniref:Uncharacterized protein n=1 Tax=Caerostris darwini TaxID=1538125 RepID=A0AAV4WUG5_9ARAC|nr:hypothetical protein CDAR_186021 [Caerostris darwini]
MSRGAHKGMKNAGIVYRRKGRRRGGEGGDQEEKKNHFTMPTWRLLSLPTHVVRGLFPYGNKNQWDKTQPSGDKTKTKWVQTGQSDDQTT